MKKSTIILLVSGIILLLILGTAGIIVSYGIGTHNTAISLETQANAQTTSNTNAHDAMWKIISGKAGVADKYYKDYKDLLATEMSNRYGNPEKRTQALMNWIKERNSNFDPSLYKDISQAIEAQRTKFEFSQNRLIDIKQQHDFLRLKFPSSIVMNMFNHQEIKINIITSTKTKEAFSSGIDDEASPFPISK